MQVNCNKPVKTDEIPECCPLVYALPYELPPSGDPLSLGTPFCSNCHFKETVEAGILPGGEGGVASDPLGVAIF